MSADPEAEKAAKEFIDGALAARERLGYTAKVSKKSYRRAVEQATGVFELLRSSTLKNPRRQSTAPSAARRTAHSDYRSTFSSSRSDQP
jgi:hypothetical protein